MSEDIYENIEENEQAEFTKKIYIDKSKKLFKFAVWILFFDFVTYGIFALLGSFDFGIFFEMFTFIFILISIMFIDKDLILKARMTTIIAVIPIVALLIYDLLDLISHLGEILDELIYYGTDYFLYNYYFYLVDIPLVLIVIFLFIAYGDLSKSIGDKKYKTSTDWFYHKK